MNFKYLSIEEAAKRTSKNEFLRNVRTAIIPRLIARGFLQGKIEKKHQLVADDAALEHTMRLGVEAFVHGQQGYSFMATRAPIPSVSQKLKRRPGVVKYDEKVKPLKMGKDEWAQPDEKFRHSFLLQMVDAPEWSVLIQTVHWFHGCDSIMATALASSLSKDLQTLAVAAWDDDFSGSSLIICENGDQKGSISDTEEEGGWESFYEFFYEQGVYLPESFIATQKGAANLHVADPSKVLRADYVQLKVPSFAESNGPHVLEKADMMTEAEDLVDEQAFVQHIQVGVWTEAQAVLASGDF